jgi:hypothetical protein
MEGHRSFKIMLTEAELLASSPDFVADFLLNNRRTKWSSKNVIDDETEKNLLARKDARIDLALARYAISKNVLSELYGRSQQALRAAVLSNERHAFDEGSMAWLFISNTYGDVSWLGRLSDLELEAFFSNKSIDDNTVRSFFEQDEVWNSLNDDQRLDASAHMIENLIDRVEQSDPVSGWDEYCYNSVFDSAWKFSQIVEVSYPWAARLEKLYRELLPECFSDFDPLETAKRWNPAEPADGNTESDEFYSRYGYLTVFSGVRFGLGLLAARLSYREGFDRAKILENPDIVIRCAGYQEFKLSTQEIRSACDKDGAFACRHLIQNEKNWRKPENREIIEDACRKISKDQEHEISIIRDYNIQSDKIEQKYPSWFQFEPDMGDNEFEKNVESENGARQVAEYIFNSSEYRSTKKKIENAIQGMILPKAMIIFLTAFFVIDRWISN